MAQTVKLKRSNTAGTIPTTSNLALGEVAINTKDGKFFIRKHVDGSTGDAIHAYAPQGINAYGTQELIIKVVTKTTAHPNHGSGSSSGYTVQGLEGPFLALIPGNTYKFDVSDSTNSSHPFRFYLDAAKATAYTTGVTTNGSAGNNGAYVQIAVTTSTPQVLYYQCSSHSLMGSAAYVASDAIAANAVGSAQIAQNSITSAEIPNNSIGATQISASVLAAKQDNLGNNSITAAMISQNTVGISELNVTDGSANQVLTTDGSGTLSFSTVSSGGEAFKNIAVSGQSNVVADAAADTLTFAGSGGMTITTTAGTDTVTFSSSTTPADDSVVTAKIADLNVTAGKLAANSVTSAKIATDAVGASEIAANSVGISELNLSDGSANQVLTTNGSGTLSFADPSSGTVTETFKTISVSGQDNVVADAATDTLTFAAGSNMTITTNASSDTITFASSGGGGSSSSFAKNTFTGDGSDTTFTLTNSISNEDNLIVFIDGVYQADNVFSVSGTTLTFATAPVNGRLIEVFQLEGGIVGSAPVIATMTGDGSDTTLSLGATPNSENSTFVTIDGVMQHKSTYSVSGSTLTFSTAPPNGTAVEAITLINQTTTSLQDGDGDTKIQLEESSDEDKIRFDTAGSERVIIDSLGIDITGNILSYNNNTDDTNKEGHFLARQYDSGTETEGFQILQYFSNSSDNRIDLGGASSQYNAATSINFYTAANTTTRTGTNRLTINSSGYVGIGTTSPAGPLHVDGHTSSLASIFEANGNGDTVPVKLKVKANNGTTSFEGLEGEAGSASTDNGLAILGTNNIKFKTGATERMRIDSSGNVDIKSSNIYLTGSNDRRIKLSDSGVAGVSNDNNTVHIRGDNDFLKLMAAGNGGLIYEENGTEHLSIASGGQLKFNAGFGSSGKAYGVRAWVNFNGTGTVAIRDNGNVSSITDGGTGNYSVNFTTAMPDTNYAILGTVGHTSASNLIGLTVNHVSGSLPATGSVHVYTAYQNTYAFDSLNVSVAIVR